MRVRSISSSIALALTVVVLASCTARDATIERAEDEAARPAGPPSAYPAPSGSANAAPSASASASPKDEPTGPDPADAKLPSLADDPPSDEKTPRPDKGEWAKAQQIRPARQTDRACTTHRIREWIRVDCDRYMVHATLISGTRDGFDPHITKSTPDASGGPGYIVFPARRGDRRVMMFERISKWGSTPDVLVTLQWIDGERAPILDITGLP